VARPLPLSRSSGKTHATVMDYKHNYNFINCILMGFPTWNLDIYNDMKSIINRRTQNCHCYVLLVFKLLIYTHFVAKKCVILFKLSD
jgi:hypothetical protein